LIAAGGVSHQGR
jgi:transposase